ncbi:MAG: multicopper oxidase domain-containing protein [Lysobacter sp.]
MTDPHRRRMLAGLSAVAVTALATPFLIDHWRQRRGHAHASRSTPPKRDAAQAEPAAPFQQPLRVPGRDGLMAEVTLTQALALNAQAAAFAIFPGPTTAVWHYAGMIDGHAIANPMLRVQHGDDIDISLLNGLDQATTIHWHGLVIDEANDGSGLHPVEAGAQARYRWRVRNRAGLYWYHAHPHMRTGLQLQHGLAGLLLVED